MGVPSFLSKWISREPKENAGTPSDYLEKRRHNRIDLESHESIYLQVLMPTAKGAAETLKGLVTNVSIRGCRLLFDEKLKPGKFSHGTVLVATLAVEDFPIPMSIEVIRVVGGRELAVKFKPPFPKELERLEKFLEPRCLGMSLRQIKSDFLKGDDKERTAWFQGVNETHLFCWFDAGTGEINHQQLIFLRNVVEWGNNIPLRTGVVREDVKSADMNYGWVKSELLAFDHSVNAATVESARIMLKSSSIESKAREIFLSKLKG